MRLQFLLCRETMDSYTITASPIFGALGRAPNLIYSSFETSSKTNLEQDAKIPLLPEQKEDVDRISVTQSSWLQKSSFHKQLTGELPIGHGCSMTQTIFNGNDSYFVMLHCSLVSHLVFV